MKRKIIILLFLCSLFSLVSCDKANSKVMKEVISAYIYPENVVIKEYEDDLYLYASQNVYNSLTAWWVSIDFETYECSYSEIPHTIDWKNLLLPILNYEDKISSNTSYDIDSFNYTFKMNKSSGEITITPNSTTYLVKYFKDESNHSPYTIFIYEYNSSNEVICYMNLLWSETNSIAYYENDIYYLMSLEDELVKVAKVNSESKYYTACKNKLIIN